MGGCAEWGEGEGVVGSVRGSHGTGWDGTGRHNVGLSWIGLWRSMFSGGWSQVEDQERNSKARYTTNILRFYEHI